MPDPTAEFVPPVLETVTDNTGEWRIMSPLSAMVIDTRGRAVWYPSGREVDWRTLRDQGRVERVIPPEPRYTLEEAREILARRECDQYGHDLNSSVIRGASGIVLRHVITCDRCGAHFQEVTDA